MQIQLNQNNIECSEGTTLADLLAAQGISSRHIALALNQAVVSREAWPTTELREGDQVLVIGAIKGG